MDNWMNSREWEELLRENPELARDLEAFFRQDDKGVSSVVGFYAVLKMRLRRLLTVHRSQQPTGEAKVDDETPPRPSDLS